MNNLIGSKHPICKNCDYYLLNKDCPYPCGNNYQCFSLAEHDARVRADAIKGYKQSDEYIKEGVQRYLKGRADKYNEITAEYMLLTKTQVTEIRAAAIDECIKMVTDEQLCQALEKLKEAEE